MHRCRRQRSIRTLDVRQLAVMLYPFRKTYSKWVCEGCGNVFEYQDRWVSIVMVAGRQVDLTPPVGVYHQCAGFMLKRVKEVNE